MAFTSQGAGTLQCLLQVEQNSWGTSHPPGISLSYLWFPGAEQSVVAGGKEGTWDGQHAHDDGHWGQGSVQMTAGASVASIHPPVQA